MARGLAVGCGEIDGRIPFMTDVLIAKHGAEDLSVLYLRLVRDGWQRVGPHWEAMKERKKRTKVYRRLRGG